MALVKFGSIITDSRGKIGGQQLKLSRYGVVISTKHVELANRSPRRSTIRANFSNLAKAWWADLTPTQRDDWRTLAAANPLPNTWGDLFAITGQAYYIRLNQRLFTAGLAQTNSAPADQVVAAPTSATLTLTAPATASLAFAPTPAPANHILYAFAAGPLSPGITNPSGKLRFLAVSGSAQTSPWDISSALSSLLGPIRAGRQYFVQLAYLNTANAALSSSIDSSAIAT